MPTSQDIFKKQLEPIVILNEKTISTFITQINEIEQHAEYISIGYYDFPIDSFWDYLGDEETETGFTSMHKETVLNILSILRVAGIEKHLQFFCSIIQTHISRKILGDIVEPTVISNLSFSKEFYSLYKMLSNDVLEIKIISNKKDETCIIKNTNLKLILLKSFAEQILNLDEAVDYIYQIEKGEILDSMPENKILDSAIMNLLLFLQTKTSFLHNKEKIEANNISFTNKQFELIYELLIVSGLLNENDITSPPKDYIRLRVTRAFVKKPSILGFFMEKNHLENVSNKASEIIADPEILALIEEVFEQQSKHKNVIANKIHALLQ